MKLDAWLSLCRSDLHHDNIMMKFLLHDQRGCSFHLTKCPFKFTSESWRHTGKQRVPLYVERIFQQAPYQSHCSDGWPRTGLVPGPLNFPKRIFRNPRETDAKILLCSSRRSQWCDFDLSLGSYCNFKSKTYVTYIEKHRWRNQIEGRQWLTWKRELLLTAGAH